MTAVEDRLVHPAESAVDEGSALLRAATAAGYGTRVRELLDHGWPDSAGYDTELMLWAADYGAYQVIHNRLDEYTTKPMLHLARGWVDVDPVAELKRRLDDAHAVVQRQVVAVDVHENAECIRATSADGRWIQVQTAHLAIVTYIEELLGIGASLDELKARALLDRIPNSVNWNQSWHSATKRLDTVATTRWAMGVLQDPDARARLFAAEVLHTLAVGPAPCRDEVLLLLRTRLTAESDADVLTRVITAFAEYNDLGLLPEIVAHAEHHDPRVRRQVAEELSSALMNPASMSAGADLLAALASDHDGRVRASAIRVLCTHAFEHPMTGRAIATNRDDPDPYVRPEVLSAMARAGDATACTELARLADEAEPGSQLAMMAYDAEHWALKIASADA
ncbi:HEAT repeat domain-containing protein [Actinoplanes sp. NPDC051861]|uniref:HEAT repeat domain-containing protein n=1 Tax=Actinoplanes sp. NPDC051861 TaxID=3155170 RepID=UPI00341E3B63